VTKPYEPKVKDDRIYGRGSEDNGQSMMASMFAVKILKNLGMKPKRTVALAFVADEEHGSEYGIQHLIAQKLFRKDDRIVVPDGGSEDGSFIEISEKGALWLKIRTIGAQTHASRPHKGLNAHRIGMEYALALDKMLHEKYPLKNEYFDPPESTFEPTMKEKNVDAINIVPGEDISYVDCRILPNYNLDEVLKDIRELARNYEKKTRAKIDVEIVQKSIAPKPTDAKAKVVTALEEAIENVRKVKPRIGGIGGGTCAAFFRKIDIPAVVWCTIDETAHQPNEYSKIKNLVDDAKVYAHLAMA
jgi:succinyl-diaminopimelate desuccinylase